MRSLLLVHSPLLGPSSWWPVAQRARAQGVTVAIPNLGPAFDSTSGWTAAVASTSAAVCPTEGDVMVVGHSGSGYYVPAIGAVIGLDRVAFGFVDAVLPPLRGKVIPSAAIDELLDRHTTEGWLEPWLDWWPEEVLDRVLPDKADRTALSRDQPTVRRIVYDEPVEVPDGWQGRPVVYVRTSQAYAAEAAQAKENGWAVSELNGTHLSIVSEPDAVLSRLLEM